MDKKIADLEYALGMTDRMPTEQGKFDRWLGFIQGILYAHNVRTIDEMREDNRVSSQHGLNIARTKLKEAIITTAKEAQ